MLSLRCLPSICTFKPGLAISSFVGSRRINQVNYFGACVVMAVLFPSQSCMGLFAQDFRCLSFRTKLREGSCGQGLLREVRLGDSSIYILPSLIRTQRLHLFHTGMCSHLGGVYLGIEIGRLEKIYIRSKAVCYSITAVMSNALNSSAAPLPSEGRIRSNLATYSREDDLVPLNQMLQVPKQCIPETLRT